MKIRPKKSLSDWEFTHQDLKQLGIPRIVKLRAGKAIDIPDPNTSVNVPLSFLSEIEEVKSEKPVPGGRARKEK